MEFAAEREPVDAQRLRELVAEGRAVVLTNAANSPEKPCAVGAELLTKVNANIGTSKDYAELDRELVKAAAAEEAGADTLMDLSTGGDIPAIRKRIIANTKLPVGSVPVYEAGAMAAIRGENVVDMTADDMMQAVRNHMADGIAFVTIHSGVTRDVVATVKSAKRVCGIVSRGGSFIAGWMQHTGQENPFYERFDELIDMAREFDCAFSLGDGLRPGCIADAMDRPQIHELMVLGELRERAVSGGVQVMIEGPGHVPIDQIKAQVKMAKEVCGGAPLYVLGPLVTDIAPGYDHITGAVGGSIAAAAGADFLCYVTPSEHLSLPDEEQVRRGVIASRIAAHAGDIGKGVPGAAEWDRKLSTLRRARDWKEQLKYCIDPVTAQQVRDAGRPADDEVCSMCGEYCVFKLADDAEG